MLLKAVIFFFTSLAMTSARFTFTMDERWVCSVKKSCLECLKLTHCTWCTTENKCFSQNLPMYNDFCLNSTINHDEGYGLSLAENAECSCAGGKKDLQCYPPGIFDGPECSGRGECKCGHCLCNPNPDPENPSKMIMGDYCEFDNFSCNDPKCNEGPYSLSQPVIVGDDHGNGDDNRNDDVDETGR